MFVIRPILVQHFKKHAFYSMNKFKYDFKNINAKEVLVPKRVFTFHNDFLVATLRYSHFLEIRKFWHVCFIPNDDAFCKRFVVANAIG